MSYKNWAVGDQVSIGVVVTEFCSASPQFIYLYGNGDMELYPNALNLQCRSDGCNPNTCINASGRQVNFFSCMNYHTTINDVNCSNTSYDKYYRQLGSVTTGADGVASFVYTVTSQDLADYNDAFANLGKYNIVACISDSLATSSHAISFGDITVIANVCVDVACPDICVGNDLYTQVCNPSTGNCIQGALKEANSFECTSTHYLAYDLSALPTDFLNLLTPNIVAISNAVGEYIVPLIAGNIIYNGSKYVDTDNTFRIYVTYTTGLTGDVGYRWKYNSSIGKLEAIPLISTLEDLGRLLAGVVIFRVLCIILEAVGGPWGLALAAIVAVVGAVWIVFTVHDIVNKITSSIDVPQPSNPVKNQINNIDDFVTNWLIPRCDAAYPECANLYYIANPTPTPSGTPPVTPTPSGTPAPCDCGTMRAYLSCRNNALIAQNLYNHQRYNNISQGPIASPTPASAMNSIIGMQSPTPELTCSSTYIDTFNSVDSCLANCTCTPQDAAKISVTCIEKPIKDNTEQAKAAIDCPNGYWDVDKQACVTTCSTPVFGYCADGIITVGGIVLGGYIVYKLVKIVGEKKGEI